MRFGPSFLCFALILSVPGLASAQAAGPATLAPVVWAVDGSPPAELRSWVAETVRTAQADAPGRWTAAGGDPVTLTLTGRPSAWAAVLQRPSTGGMKYYPFTSPDDTSALALRRLLGALVRPASPPGPAPEVVDRFDLSSLQGTDLPAGASFLYPSSLALRPEGGLLVATGSAVLELDRRWMTLGQPAKPLSDRGLVNFAWTAGLTPAGTLFVRSADGSSLWSLSSGGGARRWPAEPGSGGLPFGVLSDGRPFSVTANPAGIRVGSSGGTSFWPLPADASVMAAAPGPHGTVWAADTVRGLIFVLDAEGGLADIVVPEIPAGTALLKLRVGADGGFWAATQKDLRRFAPGGALVWTWTPEGGSLPAAADLQPGAGGLIYVSDFGGKAVYRLAEAGAPLDQDLKRIQAAYRETQGPGAGPEPWKTLAEAYLDQGAAEAALAAYDRYLADRPADPAAQERRRTALLGLGKARAQAADDDARAQLAAFGPETAGDAYRRAMKAYEALRASAPGDPEVTGPMQSLRRTFSDADAAPALPVPRVGRTELGPLFPGLLQSYRTRAAGSVEVTNTTGAVLKGLRAEVGLGRFVDTPASGVPADLPAGASVRVPLYVPLNDRVFDLEEDLPVQAALTLRWSDSRGDRSLETAVPVTLYRRTALTWDDTGKLAAFITPNEETVSRAAFDLLPDQKALPPGGTTVNRAAALADGLGSLPLRYVPDPAAPFSAVSSAAGAVDTVRFPRNTLAFRGGDCDDTTALLASVFEASGIATAILTTPGHVFLAFDTGEAPGSAWLYTSGGRRPLVREGRLWIPVESTVLSQGFDAAWKAASDLVDRYEGSSHFEVLSVASLRDRYPALPLPPAPGAGPRWDRSAVASLQSATWKTWASDLLGSLTSALGAGPAAGTPAAANRLARAQAVWGRPDLAEATLKALVTRSPGWTPAYLNLAALKLAQGDREGARAWIAAGRRAGDPAQVAAWAAKAGLELPLAGGPAVADTGPAAPGRASAPALPPWSGD